MLSIHGESFVILFMHAVAHCYLLWIKRSDHISFWGDWQQLPSLDKEAVKDLPISADTPATKRIR